jgi:hypothetical protein
MLSHTFRSESRLLNASMNISGPKMAASYPLARLFDKLREDMLTDIHRAKFQPKLRVLKGSTPVTQGCQCVKRAYHITAHHLLCALQSVGYHARCKTLSVLDASAFYLYMSWLSYSSAWPMYKPRVWSFRALPQSHASSKG